MACGAPLRDLPAAEISDRVLLSSRCYHSASPEVRCIARVHSTQMSRLWPLRLLEAPAPGVRLTHACLFRQSKSEMLLDHATHRSVRRAAMSLRQPPPM